MEKYLIFTDIEKAFESNMESIRKNIDSILKLERERIEKEKQALEELRILKQRAEEEKQRKKEAALALQNKLTEQNNKNLLLLNEAKKLMGYDS